MMSTQCSSSSQAAALCSGYDLFTHPYTCDKKACSSPHLHSCAHTHAHKRTHTHIHTLSLTSTHILTHARDKMHVHSHTHTHAHKHTHTHTHTHTHRAISVQTGSLVKCTVTCVGLSRGLRVALVGMTEKREATSGLAGSQFSTTKLEHNPHKLRHRPALSL